MNAKIVTKFSLVFIWLIFSSKYVQFVEHPTSLKELHAQHILPSRPMRSGARILILVRQPDPRFTPRV